MREIKMRGRMPSLPGSSLSRLMRQAGPVVAASCVVLLFGGSFAQAGHSAGTIEDYTGCLKDDGGMITSVKRGSSPDKPCPPGYSQIHVSGGDISEVVAGTGLTGGSQNGKATLSLASSFVLPQSCADGLVAQWNATAEEWGCFNATYTAGTGLGLTSNQFSIGSTYQLPQACAAAQVAKRNPTTGAWECATDEDTTYSGADFATSSQSCPRGEVTTGIGSTGGLNCAIDKDTTYSGANFATSGQNCPGAQFARGIAGGGNLQCAAPAGLSAYHGSGLYHGGNLPDAPKDGDNPYVTIRSLNLPPGLYLLTGTMNIFNSHSPVGSGGEIVVRCRFDSAPSFDPQVSATGWFNYSAGPVVTAVSSLSSPGTVNLQCRKFSNDGYVAPSSVSITALKIGSVNAPSP